MLFPSTWPDDIATWSTTKPASLTPMFFPEFLTPASNSDAAARCSAARRLELKGGSSPQVCAVSSCVLPSLLAVHFQCLNHGRRRRRRLRQDNQGAGGGSHRIGQITGFRREEEGLEGMHAVWCIRDNRKNFCCISLYAHR